MTTRLRLAVAASLMLAAHAAHAAPADRWGGIDRWAPVADARLAQLRGGFDIGNGLVASFGFDRTVTINGVTTTIANVQIPDIGKITADQARALEAATRAQFVQNGPGNAVTAPIVTTPAATVAAPAAAAGGIAASLPPATTQASTAQAAPAVGSAAAAAPSNTPSTTAPAKAAAAGNTAAAIAAPAVAAATQAIGNSATVIQNSLNNQSIQSATTLTTSVNTLSTFHNIDFQAGLQDALIRSR